MSLSGGGLLSEWTHPEGRNISLASCNPMQAAVAAGSELHYFEILPTQVKHAGLALSAYLTWSHKDILLTFLIDFFF